MDDLACNLVSCHSSSAAENARVFLSVHRSLPDSEGAVGAPAARRGMGFEDRHFPRDDCALLAGSSHFCPRGSRAQIRLASPCDLRARARCLPSLRLRADEADLLLPAEAAKADRVEAEEVRPRGFAPNPT